MQRFVTRNRAPRGPREISSGETVHSAADDCSSEVAGRTLSS